MDGLCRLLPRNKWQPPIPLLAFGQTRNRIQSNAASEIVSFNQSFHCRCIGSDRIRPIVGIIICWRHGIVEKMFDHDFGALGHDVMWRLRCDIVECWSSICNAVGRVKHTTIVFVVSSSSLLVEGGSGLSGLTTLFSINANNSTGGKKASID